MPRDLFGQMGAGVERVGIITAAMRRACPVKRQRPQRS